MKHLEGYVPLQVRYGDNPWTNQRDGWRVLVITMLLNRTSRDQVAGVLPRFFSCFPTAVVAEAASYDPWCHDLMKEILAPLGFQHSRTLHIGSMSKQWLDHESWRRTDQVHRFDGCGQYATEAWRIFMEEDFTVPAEDEVLEEWRLRHGRATIGTS